MPFLIEVSSETQDSHVFKPLLSKKLAPYCGDPKTWETENVRVFYTNQLSFSDNDTLTSIGNSGYYRLTNKDGYFEISSDELHCCPLWLARVNDRTYITSEAKSFLAIEGFSYDFKTLEEIFALGVKPKDYSPYHNIENVTSFTLAITGKEIKRIEKKQLDFSKGSDLSQLSSRLTDLAQPCKPESSLAGLLSGGIDSSLACAASSKGNRSFKAYTLSTSLGDEFEQAKKIADHLELKLEKIHMERDNFIESIHDVIYHNENYDGLTAEILGQIHFCVRNIKEEKIITGYGADLLFGGMLRHQAYMDAVQAFSTQELIERTFWTGEMRPMCFMALGKSIHHFYWNFEFIDYAVSTVEEDHFDGVNEKVPLRKAAMGLGYLPESLAYNIKQGLTDGTKAQNLFSDYLGLPDGYHYKEKTQYSFEYLKKRLTDESL
jgi:carbapenam-3-carboxylate synthase